MSRMLSHTTTAVMVTVLLTISSSIYGDEKFDDLIKGGEI